MLELKNINKKVGDTTCLQDISLQLSRQELNILLGPTGSGKTTLMRIMAGLEKPDSGEILFDGESVLGIPVQKRNVAMVYQQFINYPSMSVFDNIASPLTLTGVSKGEIERKVNEAAELLQLTPMLRRAPDTLSGGQQQRLALARALVKQADLVLLDEPLANLDYKLREELRSQLPALFADKGAVLVSATTEPAEALVLGGNTACMHEGRVVQFGPTLDGYRQPKDLLAARTFSDPPLNTVSVQMRDGAFQVPGSDSTAVLPGLPAAEGSFTLGVRAHHLSTERRTEEDLVISGKVSVIEISGSESFVHFEYEGQPWVILQHGITQFQQDDNFESFVSIRNLLLFDDRGYSCQINSQNNN